MQTPSVVNGRDESFIPTRRGRIKSVTIYELTYSELEILQSGGRGSTYLNFALTLLSSALSFTIALVIMGISIETWTVFELWVLAIFGFLTTSGYVWGIVCLTLWWINRQSVTNLVEEIRERVVNSE